MGNLTDRLICPAPGAFEPESDGGQRLVEPFDDVDAATFVPFITVRVLADRKRSRRPDK
jgi:hypothetical protein